MFSIVHNIDIFWMGVKMVMQFYKNLSTSLDDVVWKTEEDMQEMR